MPLQLRTASQFMQTCMPGKITVIDNAPASMVLAGFAEPLPSALAPACPPPFLDPPSLARRAAAAAAAALAGGAVGVPPDQRNIALQF